MSHPRRPVATALRDHIRTCLLAASVVAAAAIVFSSSARAESSFSSGAGALNATARLNFSIVIPRFLFLQVGTGTPFANNAAIDTVLFDMTTAIPSIGNGVAQAGTGGDLTAGAVTARVLGNSFTAASVNLSAATTGAMSNGAGSTISWSEITVAPSALVVVPAAASMLNHPGTLAAPFADGASTTVALTPVSRVINQAARWTFTYKNTNVPASGTYGGAGGAGQVTYTIAMP